MKKISALLILAVLASATTIHVCGQTIPKIFDRYEEKEGVESVTISPMLLGIMKNGKTQDRKTQELLSKISGLRILTIADDAADKDALLSELKSVLQKGYQQIMKMKSSGERVELYHKNIPMNTAEEDAKISALLFMTTQKSSVTLVYLSGTIDKRVIEAVMNGEIHVSGK
ncbi:MAG: DUF4252 domain-containing protein [Bacteroidales bacterium]|jgi:hypothetical protein|nr:DUF4252 domain-containing protein [Bacteroidales bacterium]